MPGHCSWYNDYTKGWTNRFSNSGKSKVLLIFSKTPKGALGPTHLVYNGDRVKIGCDGGSERDALYLYTYQLRGQEQVYFLMRLLHRNLTSHIYMANDIFTGV
jgi:hypothetical protein